MKKQIHKRLLEAVEEDQKTEPDKVLLDYLRALSAEDSNYLNLPAEKRVSLSTWFDENKELFFSELLQGNFGSSILLDTFFVLCFEVGYKLGRSESQELK